jgi:hypothetical protein
VYLYACRYEHHYDHLHVGRHYEEHLDEACYPYGRYGLLRAAYPDEVRRYEHQHEDYQHGESHNAK